MKLQRFAIAVLAGFATAAWGGVTVTFSNTERYTDVGEHRRDLDSIRTEFTTYLQNLGERVAPGRDIVIDFIDVDMAGRSQFMGMGRQIRTTTGRGDGPVMRLRYAADGRPGAEETISDQDYLERSFATIQPTDQFHYEKKLLEMWFRDRFGKK